MSLQAVFFDFNLPHKGLVAHSDIHISTSLHTVIFVRIAPRTVNTIQNLPYGLQSPSCH